MSYSCAFHHIEPVHHHCLTKNIEMPPAPSRNQLKVNALKRLVKEHQLYVQELQEQEASLSRVQTAGDEYEARKAQEIVDETKRILPRVRQSIENQINEVSAIDLKRGDGGEATDAAGAISAAKTYLAGIV